LTPIDPSFALSPAEAAIAPADTPDAASGLAEATGENGGGFGGALRTALESLAHTQSDATGAAQSLANGTAADVSGAVMAVERARLAMQLASQVRNKAVEAYQEIFRTQV
jgi:flagellar hook-basal body complex protein FliE